MKLLIICGPPVSADGQNVGGLHAVVARIVSESQKQGHEPILLTKEIFAERPPCLNNYQYLSWILDNMEYDAIHIVSQELLGFLARRYCVERGLKFTTAYHTALPEYMLLRWSLPQSIPYQYMAWFLNSAVTTIVPTPSMAARLQDHGVENTISLFHGVDTDRFHPGDDTDRLLLDHLPRPIWLYVGRVAQEKNPEAFASLNLPGTKLIVGDGELETQLRQRYPDVVWAGVQKGAELARYFRASDCFIFPSLTDTFGLVILEALASGLPVAAFPVTGPADILTDPALGCLDSDLRTAAMIALERGSPTACRDFALQHTWADSIDRFISLQVPARGASPNHKAPDWLDQSDALMEQFAQIVNNAEQALFAKEPSGPYAKK